MKVFNFSPTKTFILVHMQFIVLLLVILIMKKKLWLWRQLMILC